MENITALEAALNNAEAGLRLLADPALAPLFWEPQRRGKPSSWWGHVPFAHWLVGAIRPRLLVELGTHHGVSYAAFCESVKRHHLSTRCAAVDTWTGDQHALAYGEAVYADLRAFHDPRYAGFSTLMRGTFDQALAAFSEGSVELLHIDGLHTYEAVRHDFETWRPKLSERAVVLFHDIEIRDRGFGVWRLWDELSEQQPHFAFRHSCGLGALAVGRDPPAAIAELCAIEGSAAGDSVRERLATIGGRWAAEAQAAEDSAQLQRIYRSASWRALGPLRRLRRMLAG